MSGKLKFKAKPKVNLKLKKKLDQEDENVNSHITDVLQQLVSQIEAENKSIDDKKLKTKNRWRISSLRKAIGILKEHPEEITSGFEAKKLNGIGDGTADRIDIILETGTLPELENDVVNEEIEAVESLMTIHGIGESHALDFYRRFGVKSAADLIKLWQNKGIEVGKYQLSKDMEIGFNSKFMIEMLNNIGSEEINLEMSASNRAGIILPLDGQDEGENTLMLVMPVMLNS